MQKKHRVLAFLTTATLVLGAASAVSAASVTGHPNSHSQVGRQGTKNDTSTPSLNGKANRWRRKKVNNNTSTPMPASMVAAGAKIFKAQCESCHGPSGNGTTTAPRLAGPSGVWYTFHTESALRGYIQAHMPANHPGTLHGTALKDVSAYVWTIAKSK
ncbi:c-type cytochrome [Sulfobacillus harzensis]|uniref:Cytochrome c n=1 Tax=Sulfobacillus harzensis TaxID=2729629 RepID=A0A7Y0L4P0_9FIRM|nr:cytochrome c [Sulfobacillus harzensis]NMP22335.1 cytochrome c [Sulfobacillus harzensis]